MTKYSNCGVKQDARIREAVWNFIMVGNRCVILVCNVAGLLLVGCKPVGSPHRQTADSVRGVKVELKVATCQPTNLPGLGDAILGVADRVRELAAEKERQLIETLAQDIATAVLGEFEVGKVRIEIEKFILPETDWVGVIIERPSSKIN